MTKLRISEGLSLPLDVVTEKLAFLGRTGSGKTYAAMKLAELMFEAGAHFVALDQVGVWPGLRMGPNALDVPVFGGLLGDVPLESTGGALIADVILDRGLSVVIDVSQMIPAEVTRFATDFATRLFQRKKSDRSAIHLFLEECQEVVPQNWQHGEEKMLHAFERIWKLGRNFGIGGSLISQRPQEVNKKALNMTEVLFAFQMTGPQERKAIEAWVADKGLDVDIVKALPGLEVGEPHVWSPRLLKVSKAIRIAPKLTFDLSSTPKVGDRRKAAQPLKPVDIEKLRGEMTATIERAKADDPKELRRRIVELERELAKKVAPAKAERVEVPVFDLKRFEELSGAVRAALVDIKTKVEAAINSTGNAFVDYRASARIAKAPAAHSDVTTGAGRMATRAAPIAPQTNGIKHVDGSPEVGNSGLRRILIALAQRQQGLTNRQIGIRAGISSGSGTFATYLSKARTNGWIEDAGQVRRITDAGLLAIGSYDPLPTGTALRDHWLGQLGESGAARILRVLSEAYPESLNNETIGQRANISHASGTFATYLSRLRGLELVEGGRGHVSASKELFE